MNGVFEKIIASIKQPDRMFGVLARMGFFNWMGDEQYLRLRYKLTFGKELDLNNPQTFNEKIQWLKLHDRNPEYITKVDKYAVKKYVADKIGEQYIIPTYGVWDSFDEIDFDLLPNQFVLKCTHDSGGIVICHDKEIFDKNAARKKLMKNLKNNYYYWVREWPYKNVKPRIIAEKYLEASGKAVPEDYKIFNFNGEPKMIEVDYDRFVAHKRNLYTVDWKYIDAVIKYPTSKEYSFEKPIALEEMLNLSRKLSEGMSFLRTDFYILDGKVYFGELTLYHGSGMERFEPEEFGVEIGNWIELQLGDCLVKKL